MPGCGPTTGRRCSGIPRVLDPEIRAHLEAENAYQAALMADTEALQKTLFAEMKGRIKEDDSSVPMKDGPFAYGTVVHDRRRAAALSSARRATAAPRRSCSTATRRPRARPISASAASTIPTDHDAACCGL